MGIRYFFAASCNIPPDTVLRTCELLHELPPPGKPPACALPRGVHILDERLHKQPLHGASPLCDRPLDVRHPLLLPPGVPLRLSFADIPALPHTPFGLLPGAAAPPP
ncbi:MAG TPA: hypothetical protein VK970_13020, partial [Candidatus Methylacidiphilales bacterium]|nr:hypothetical protein [Candidatus Methylacidiphilales bacterium]